MRQLELAVLSLALITIPTPVLPKEKQAGKSPGPAAAAAQNGNGTREVALDERSSGKTFGIHTARSVLTTIEFPEDIQGRAACGDCEDDQGREGDALYRWQVAEQGRYLTIRPNLARKVREEDSETTILVRLEHATLTLFVEQGERSRADTRVVFTYPNRAAESEYLRAERAKMEAAAEVKLERALRARLHQAMVDPHGCMSKSTRSRQDDIVLVVKEICYFGRDVFFTFEVENRGRTPFEIGSVQLDKGTNDGEEETRTVDNDHPEVGVVGIHLADGDAVRGPYTLTIHERGGKERFVQVTKLEL